MPPIATAFADPVQSPLHCGSVITVVITVICEKIQLDKSKKATRAVNFFMIIVVSDKWQVCFGKKKDESTKFGCYCKCFDSKCLLVFNMMNYRQKRL